MQLPEIQPILHTARLALRPFDSHDIPAVTELCGERDIAFNTLHIPHPYTLDDARIWIGSHPDSYAAGKSAVFAITKRDDHTLVGGIGLTIDPQYHRAELGYWIGKPFWGNGFCSEAAPEILRFGFDICKLNRIFATHMMRNPASGRIMEKAGMKLEGILRQHVMKWGVYEDIAMYGVVAGDSRKSVSR